MNDNALTHSELTQLILANGREVTYLITGEKGIGKTAIARGLTDILNKEISDPKKKYIPAYLDMANLSLGDLTMPVINRETRATEYYPNSQIGLHTGQPVVLMMDEWTKASKEAQNMTLPLAEEHRLGDVHLHPDSIVLASGNLPVEGLGDRIQAHQAERFIQVECKKPNADAWNAWAIDHGVDSIITTFVDQYPHILASYKDDPDGDNQYIFNPKRQQARTVSPRSLWKASVQLKKRDQIPSNALFQAMVGTIGAPAAADLLAFITMDSKLPKFEDVIAHPKTIALPDNPAAALLLAFKLVERSLKENLDAVLTFAERFEQRELTALVVNRILSAPSKNAWGSTNKKMMSLVVNYQNVFR